MSDLYTLKYPDSAGYKEHITSRDAAKAANKRLTKLQDVIMRELSLRTLTPDECATLMGESLLSIRPRFTELKAKGMIEDTGERRRNESGLMAKVYRRIA